MINLLISYVVVLTSCKNINNQNITALPRQASDLHSVTIQDTIVSTKITGYFDNDKTIDTLWYHLDTSKGEPLINCKIVLGNSNQSRNFLVSTGSGYVKFSNCQMGCITKSEITTGIYSSEEIETYLYNDNSNNWIIARTSYLTDEEKIEKTVFKKKWTIDGQILD